MIQAVLSLIKNSEFAMSLVRWFDAWAGVDNFDQEDPKRVDWSRCLPFVGMHVMCLGVIWVGWSWAALSVAGVLYAIRMFAITGFYHRYFSHRTFKTSRWCQFAFGVLGAASVQRGPLWWAAHHRNHHRHSDRETDVHSPKQHGLLWSHMGWFTSRPNFVTQLKRVSDLEKYPELRFLDRFDILVPILLGFALYGLGEVLAVLKPGLGTTGMQMLIWGFFISTIVLFHCTNTINSLAHKIGSQRYKTHDQSRNNVFLALITFGEGWHNNHHHFPSSVRQGFFWWEIDMTYYLLIVMSWFGLVWDLKPVSNEIRNLGRIDHAIPYDKAC